MNGSQIAQKVAFGYGKAGEKLGLPHDLYRASSPTVAALDPRNRLRALSFISAADPRATFQVPSKHGNPYRYGLFDTRAPVDGTPADAVQPGDYLTGATGTYFVLSVNPDEVPMVAECNAVLTVYRPVVHTQAMEAVYGGRSAATDTLIMRSFPAALIESERTQATRADLPGDSPTKGGKVYLPALRGVLIRPMDHLVDDLGRRYTAGACELTAMGWRITTSLSEA